MAYLPECGTLGYNRGRADNEPLSDGEKSARAAHEYLWGSRESILVGDDPVVQMRASQMTAGAWALGIGIVIFGALVIWQLV